ncbi:MAG: alanine--tRNA ligase [Candidatus Wildermuthbacteria bacterium]|nr:alanine--tRNA ligase [Candidatus Wildermuthbacteria bacterium]
MTADEIRSKYLAFFESKGHKVIPSASLVPENDPTTLFTGSGMQPLIPYLLGQVHPMGKRLVNSQKSFRAQDIEEVGDNRHTTFFEMLGNWSLGDYFKQEQLPWFFEFLCDKDKGLGLDPLRLFVTVFSGDSETGIPKDEEAIEIWKKLFAQKGIEAKDVVLDTEELGYEKGMQGGRIFAYGVKKNWWSRSGIPSNMPQGEPGGPDSEVFYDFGLPHDKKFGKECHPNCDCGRFMEIGNSVFMEYKKTETGFEKLAQKNVDFGGGLERLTAATINNSDVFCIDIFQNIFKEMENFGWHYDRVDNDQKHIMRIIADHVRASVFMIGDGVLPSNTERGYILRRLIRRAVLKAYQFGPGFSNLYRITYGVAESYQETYQNLFNSIKVIQSAFEEEEMRFMRTLKRGLQELEKLIQRKDQEIQYAKRVRSDFGSRSSDFINAISGKEAFDIYQTYGFPLELINEQLASHALFVHQGEFEEEFKKEFEKHKELSRTASAGRFKGGLADTKTETIRLHTAHHLLLAALQHILGDHVKQKGSNITAERLRIDFSHPAKLTQDELQQVENLVNEKIQESLDMVRVEMKKEEALKIGAQMEFGVKYGDVVSVYFAKDQKGDMFSKEFCGGPHVHNTKELGRFRIIKEEAVAAGIRRIRAVLE